MNYLINMAYIERVHQYKIVYNNNYYNWPIISSKMKDNQSLGESQICTHIGKLGKKNIQNLTSYDYTPICCACNAKLIPPNQKIFPTQITLAVCLHCGSVFCQKQQCFKHHQNQDHLFFSIMKLKDQLPSLLELEQAKSQNQTKSTILCKICGNIDQQLNIQLKQQDPQTRSKGIQSLTKIARFCQFIHNSEKAFAQAIINKFTQFVELQQQNEHQVFGLKNLGNTCFLNSVLQCLYYTQPFHQMYKFYEHKSNKDWNYVISKQKNKRKQLEYFYDALIQKNQSESWVVVGDKKSKKQRRAKKQIQQFVPSGIIKDSSFNTIISKFIKIMTQRVKFKQQHKDQQKIVYQPVQILAKLSEYDSKYKLKQEQDAEELLIFIIDVLSQGQMLALTANAQDKKQKYAKVQHILGRQKLSPTQQLFGSYLPSRVVCLSCKKQSWTVDFTYHFPVQLEGREADQSCASGDKNTPIKGINFYRYLLYPKNSQASIKDHILYSLFHAQRLTNKQNYYSCENCFGLSAIKQFYIIDPPEIMIISLKRFEHKTRTKITKHIKFDQFMEVDSFVLRHTSEEEEEEEQAKQSLNHRYELYGVIVHKGETISSGHYLSFIKRRVKQEQAFKTYWYELSDQKSRKVTLKQILKQQAYVLLYRKISYPNVNKT